MGALLSIPLLGGASSLIAGAGLSCLGGVVGACTGRAATAFCKSCNCNSSVATRIGFSILLLVNSMLSWIMLSDWAIKRIESWSYDYLKLDCKEGTCYGVLAVHRINFALGLFHLILACLLVGVNNTKTKRAAIQNGWWGPKILAWLALLVLSFFIPNGFFVFYSRYVSLIGAAAFIFIGLVLLIDFAHSWSERCLDNWENSEDPNSTFWRNILIGSTLSCYAAQIALTVVDYVFFGSNSSCGLNQFFITFNLILCLLVSFISVTPAVQDANPKAGLGQSGMVVAYCTYLVTSAVANRDDKQCNPLTARAEGAQTSMVVLGALFTFLAIAYSTSRAATQSKALRGKKQRARTSLDSGTGQIRLPESSGGDDEEMGALNSRPQQPRKQESMRYQALKAAVDAGSLPESALDEMRLDDDDDDGSDAGAPGAEDRDDERVVTKYNYTYFHIIFFLSTMYIAMLLTNWNVVSIQQDGDSDYQPVKIGRSTVAMWVRIVSGWLCLVLYGWTLVAPVLFPERFD